MQYANPCNYIIIKSLYLVRIFCRHPVMNGFDKRINRPLAVRRGALALW
jgi:hypothetical protein